MHIQRLGPWVLGLILISGAAVATADDLTIRNGSAQMQLAPSPASYLTFEQLDLEAALCPPSLHELGIAVEALAPPDNDPDAIRVYLEQQGKPNGDPMGSGLGALIDGNQKQAGGQCGSASVKGAMTHLCLDAIDIVETSCADWNLDVTLDPLVPQPVITWNIYGGSGGGLFTIEVTLALLLKFTRIPDDFVVEMRRTLKVEGGGPWNRVAGPGGFESSFPYEIDTDCDCADDTAVPATSDFVPGWQPGSADESLPGKVCLRDEAGDAQLCFWPYLVDDPAAFELKLGAGLPVGASP